MTRFHRCVACVAAAFLLAAPAHAQGLRDTFSSLFGFGGNGVQLFLPGSADPSNPMSVQVHGEHYIPASVGANGALIEFIANAISRSAADAPIAAASAGTTFRFVNGVPVATSVSPGPLFGERAPTLGRGRVFVGFNRNNAHYKSLRGVPISDLRLIFTHQNVTPAEWPACNAVTGGDCTLMGVPDFENDFMQFNLSLNVDVTVNSFYLSYGLLDHLDVSFALPVVTTSLSGTSNAQIVPMEGLPVAHFFAGTPTDPVLSASKSVGSSATGIGDAAVRMKLNLNQTDRAGLSLLVDARLPTGNVDDLLGSGKFSARALAVVSARFADFTPHANLGMLYRAGELENSAVLATVGFDNRLSPWATLAADLITEFQVGANKVRLPTTVNYDFPFRRSLQPSPIPEIRDDLISGSFGFKFRTFGELTGVSNVIVPLNRGGLRANTLWTFGVEYGF